MSAILEAVRTKYKTALPTKVPMDVLFIWGHQWLMVFYYWGDTFLEGKATYLPDADISGIYRFDGLKLKSSMQLKLLNRNYDYSI